MFICHKKFQMRSEKWCSEILVAQNVATKGIFSPKYQPFIIKWIMKITENCEYCEIFKNTYFEHLRATASVSLS